MEIYRNKEIKEQELKNTNKTPESSPESTSTADTEILTPQLTDTLVTSGNGEQKNANSEDSSEDSEDSGNSKDFKDSEDPLHNIA